MINKKGYRSDIDGLRAIAVLMVVWFHAKLPGFTSGFIGVDIFFVISGYLITGKIINDIHTEKFNILTFYSQRLLRLAPAFLTLLVFCTVIVFIFYLPEDLLSYLRTAKYALLYDSNQVFSKMIGGYFDSSSEYFLLLHTWSLSIEWQWYLLLPIVLWGLTKSLSKKSVSYAIYIMAFLFSFFALYSSSKGISNSAHYYSFISRIFELLVGSSVALLPIVKQKKSTIWLHSLFSIGAIVLILYIAQLSEVEKMFPNYWALLIVVLSGLIIYTGSYDFGNYGSKILSFKPLVWIGLISYSIYLWHWPLFSLVRYLNIVETFWIKGLIIIFSIVIGWISWLFIEQKTRHLKILAPWKIIIILFCIPVILMIGLNHVSKKYQGFPARFADNYERFFDVVNKFQSKERAQCIRSPMTEEQKGCLIEKTKTPELKGIILGDSYANQYWRFLEVLSKDVSLSIESFTSPSCLMLRNITAIQDDPFGDQKRCVSIKNRQLTKIDQNYYDVVIIAQFWSAYLSHDILELDGKEKTFALNADYIKRQLYSLIETIVATGAIPVVIDENYNDLKNNDNKCYNRQSIFRNNIREDKCYSPLILNESEQFFHNLFIQLQKDFPQLIYIDPKDILCEGGICKPFIDGIPIHNFTTHLNDYASYRLGEEYIKKYGNPFKNIYKNSKRLMDEQK